MHKSIHLHTSYDSYVLLLASSFQLMFESGHVSLFRSSDPLRNHYIELSNIVTYKKMQLFIVVMISYLLFIFKASISQAV